ncbi:MAG: hypothetical protein DCC67_10970 [Planctomycetota bacterium]|nr:MAG: hypothetical protein DCC67_10970 [Planctomycetota bacterium]
MRLPSLMASAVIVAAVASNAAAADSEEGFRPLFNDKNLAGWHLRYPDGKNLWSVEDGVLRNIAPPGEHGTDLVTDDKFWNFTVRYEYMVPEKSNSGFYLRGRHELQIYGDFARGEATKSGNGAIYNFKAPDKFVSRPGDQWQEAEATIVGDRITLVLNGEKVHDGVQCRVATGSEIDDKVDEPGPIFLQGDHGTVYYRKLRIKELK